MNSKIMKELVLSIKRRDLKKMRSILEKNSNIDINVMDVFGKTLAHYCVVYGSLEIAEYLYKKGLDFSVESSLSHFTPMQLALSENRPDMVEFLVSIGVSIDAKTRDGFSLLHVAVLRRNIDVIKVLLRNGVDPNTQDNDKQTPLHIACWLGDLDVASTLVKAKANINAEDSRGLTPLHISIICGNPDLFKLIALKGGDFNKQDNYGLTPLRYILLLKPNERERISKALSEISSQIHLPATIFRDFTLNLFDNLLNRFLSPYLFMSEEERKTLKEISEMMRLKFMLLRVWPDLDMVHCTDEGIRLFA